MKNIPIANLSEKKIQSIAFILLFCNPLIGMAVDLIAPSLPAIAVSLQVSSSMSKGVISLYLFGYALGNFFTGFLTDSLGRQKLLRLGLLGFMLASLSPILFPSIQTLLIARFLQGLMIGATAVVIRAIYSDILSPEKLIRLGPLLGAMWGIGPVIGPVIGGYLQSYFGWQAGFCFFAIISLILLIIIFITVPETHFNKHPLHFKTMQKNLLEVLSHRLFLALILLMGLNYSVIIVFNTAGPFLIQTTFHNTPVFFGHFAFFLGLVFLLSTLLCRFMIKQFEIKQLLLVMINTIFVFSFLLMTASYFLPESIMLVAIGSAIMFFGSGFIFPMSMGKGMSLFRHIAGTASAVMFLIQILLTSLSSFLSSFVTMYNAIPLMWLYFILVLISTLVYWGVFHLSSNTPQT